MQINEIGERIKLSPLGTLNYTDVCSSTVDVPASEYHVIVKSGLSFLFPFRFANAYNHNDREKERKHMSNNKNVTMSVLPISDQVLNILFA